MKKPIMLSALFFMLWAPSALTAQDDYSGTPFKTHDVPGTVEAEDYDLGGEGIAWSYKNSSLGSQRSYRPDDAVAISGGNGGLVLGNTSAGDWTRYTLNVTQEGSYEVDVVCSSGADNGSFTLYVDEEEACRIQRVPNEGWDKYSPLTVKNVQLRGGRRIFKWLTGGGMDVDKFVFRRTGDLAADGTTGAFPYTYPLTQTYDHNPLFVAFPSPMYGSKFVGTLYTADPSAHVWNIDGEDVLYVYASHDMEPSQGCDRMDRYHIFSTTDLHTWTDHGEFLNADQTNEALGTTGDGFMWAPDAAYNPRDQHYYFIYPHKVDLPGGDSEWRHVVARSERPDGGFVILGYVHGIPSTIDPCLFVDDDGQAYVYTSGAGKGIWGGRLQADDWTRLDGDYTPQAGLQNVHEAPFCFKRNGVYYLTYSDGHSTDLGGNQLLYATADNPLGPWTFRGVYMQPHGEDTAHGSIVQFKGQWYQFYHTGNYSGQGALRSVCFDKVEFAPDGSIMPVHTWGQPKGGVAPVVTLNDVTKIEAEDYNEGGSHTAWYKRPTQGDFILGDTQENDIEVKTQKKITYVAAMRRKEWARYTINVAEQGRYAIVCRMRQTQSGSRFRVGIDGCWVRAAEVNVSSGTNLWGDTRILNVELTEGEHCLEWRSMNGCIDLDYITISRSVTSVPGTIEAEDFDDGQYQFNNGSAGNAKSYRMDQGVAIRGMADIPAFRGRRHRPA